MTFEIINVKQFVNAGSLVNDGQPGLYMNAVYIHTYIYFFFILFAGITQHSKQAESTGPKLLF